MATKAEKSRSDLIRECLASAKKPSEKEAAYIMDTLKQNGVSVSKQLVYQVKAALKKKRRRAAASVAANARFNGSKAKKKKKKEDAQGLIIAKNLLDSFSGDLSAAKQSLEIVSKILNS
jgi:hypothetical protein